MNYRQRSSEIMVLPNITNCRRRDRVDWRGDDLMSKEKPKIREKEGRTDKKGMTRRQLLKIGAIGAGASAVTVVTSGKGFAKHGRSANFGAGNLVPPSNDKEEELMQSSLERSGGPLSPLAAATQANPYPYYAKLVAENPIYWDADLKLWVASSAEAVTRR
jgi:hypothetical protein